MRRLAYLVAVSAAAVAIGCGGDDENVNNNADDYEGTDAEVAGLVDDFANAARDGDGTRVCEEIFSPELADNVEQEAGQSCPTEVQANLEEGEYELEIDSLEVEGDAATVGVTDQEDRSNVLHIRRIDAAWQIVSVTPGL